MTPELLAQALALVRGEEAPYRALFRPGGEGVAPTPESFCRGALQRLGDALGLEVEGWIALAERAAAKGGGGAFLDLLAAQAACDAQRWQEAMQLAKRATARQQREVHAHALFVRASAALQTGRPAPEGDLKGFFCPRPFEDVELTATGHVHSCCPAWLPVPIGNMKEAGWEAIWNSGAAQAVRGSILDGSFRYCSRLHCPQIINHKLPRRDEVKEPEHRRLIEHNVTRLERGPRRVVMSHDRSCNLACPSCRREVITARKGEQDELAALAERVIYPLLREAEEVKVTGSGDPFASHHFREVLRRINPAEFPRLKVILQTNGLLCDERAWADLELDGIVDSIWVSADAATPETYASLRRGGTFERFLQALAFMAGLRRQRRIRRLRLDAVVQARNFREMPAVVELARAFGVDRVHFQLIRNWGTFSPAEFQGHNIGAPDHPEHAAFLAVLRHPALVPAYVDLSTLRGLYDRARAASPLAA